MGTELEWNAFVESCHTYFEGRRQNSLFPLVEAIDGLYQLAPEKAPFPRSAANEQSSDSFHQCFFVCHKAFLSAAMMTAMALPEDGEGITRRALEAAKTCLAIKLDPANGEIWNAFQKRVTRWRERHQGKVPKTLALQYNKVQAEPLYQELQGEIGSLSDFGVHFTPEFFGRYVWEEQRRPEGGNEYSFGLVAGEVEIGFLRLSKHHELIFRVFDRCQDGRMLSHPEVRAALDHVCSLHNHFLQLLKPRMDAMTSREPS